MAKIRQPYGEAILRTYKVGTDTDTLPILTTRSLPGPQIVAVHILVSEEQLGLTEPIPPEDTFIVGVSLTGASHYELWSKGRPFITEGLAPHSLRIGHLGDEYQSRIIQPYESVAYLIRRASLDAFTHEEDCRRITNLSCSYGTVDPTMVYLTKTLLPLFARPQEASPFFVDHVGLAVTAYLIDQYGDKVASSAARARGGLTPVQMRRVQEMLANNLTGNLPIASLARECNISRRQLTRAFKKTTGLTLHQRLQQMRIEQAKDMLKNSDLPISVIAFQCGFVDQSHFTKVFFSQVQATPAAWRRQIRG